ncbi:MAG: PQQ-binding-like beta-propeller repeat protein [Verrucomicrobiota bacterium]
MMKRFSALLVVGISCSLVSLSQADSLDQWGHWRGADGNGISRSAQPPTEWSESANVKWKVEIPGRGSGSPVVWGNRVFVVSAVSVAAEGSGDSGGQGISEAPFERSAKGGKKGKGKGQRPGRGLSKLSFELYCFDRETGELNWKQVAAEAIPHEGTHQTNGFASASPCSDGERVYAHFGSRGLFCYDMEGALLWKRTDFGQMTTRATFGEGSSPTLAGDSILVPWDHEGPSSLFALNKFTGETLWKVERDEPTCWATPLVVEEEGKKQVIMNGQNFARAYDLGTGEELWRCSGQTDRPVASPVSAGGLVFVGSGFRGSFLGAFRLGGRGDIEGTGEVAWTTADDTPDIASLLLSDGRLYFHKGKTGILTCLDAKSGEVLFGPSRIPGVNSTYASPIAAGGHVYLTDRSGQITVIKDAASLEVIATNSLGEGVDATPAPVGQNLFVRGESHLFCLGE